ncbi:unnamed protein product [Psylliodes chrysocephalus]|uniref:TTF-type domain-containing protein n=1 Tax=Psylliodes chrysocephalus TaxID=3402493 RepID=A0A9P0DA62_9CUCU|nr:unnamed protein product [Psylliodes chrysocephala]
MAKKQTCLDGFFRPKIPPAPSETSLEVENLQKETDKKSNSHSEDTGDAYFLVENPNLQAGPSQPKEGFKYTTMGDRRRSFQVNWYDSFRWLEYSIRADSAFCYYCRLFASERKGCAEETFLRTGFKNWKKATEKFKKHGKSSSHRKATIFFLEKKPAGASVACQIDIFHKECVKKNREYLNFIFETILFLEKQGIPLRGHNESADSKNRGNFLELLNLRCSDKNLNFKEFMQSKICNYTSNQSQTEIISMISEYIIKDIAYDGGSNMSGKFNGLSAKFKEVEPRALYVHCHAHLLELAVSKCCENVKPLRDTLGTVNTLYNIIEASAKRHDIFQKMILEVVSSDTNNTKLAADASGALKIILNEEFLFSLLVLEIILGLAVILSKELQSPQLIISSLLLKAKATIKSIKHYRAQDRFDEIHKKMKRLSLEIQALGFDVKEISLPRQRKLPKKLDERPENAFNFYTAEDFMRTNILFAAIDNMVENMRMRFSENDYKFIAYIENCLMLNKNNFKKEEANKINEFYKLTEDMNQLYRELEIYRQCFSPNVENSIEDCTQKFLDSDLKVMLPLVWKLFQIILTCPVSTASAERYFSTLKILKDYLRNTMGEERLTGLALMYIEKDNTLKMMSKEGLDILTELFASQKDRRMMFY